MENEVLINLGVKYGLDEGQISKVVDMAHQAGFSDVYSKDFEQVVEYICDKDLVNEPAEEVIEDLRKNGYIKN